MSILCKVGLHRWEPTIFVNGDPGLEGEACARCYIVRVETPNGWAYLVDVDECPTCDVDEDAPNPSCASWVHPGNGPSPDHANGGER